MASELKPGISRQLSMGSFRRSGSMSFQRQNSLDPKRNNFRFSFGRQSSLDPIRRSPETDEDYETELEVPNLLDSVMQLLFMASQGDVAGVQELLDDGVDVNSIDLDGRTALHIAACEGHVDVVKLLLTRNANIDARDRWGSTAANDAKYYGNIEVYNVLKARGATIPNINKAPMAVTNPREVPEYELNPHDIQIRKGDGISKGSYQVAKWNGTRVSIKILDKESHANPESIEMFHHELKVLEKVRHPNVVQFIGAVTQNLPMMIVVEYNSKGDLATFLQKKGRSSSSKALRFALEIARGMNYLHECKPEPVIHCDLKPKNILLEFGGQLKVSGFGVFKLSAVSPDNVKLVHPDAIDRSNVYVAPEIYRNEAFDKSVDVHSYGVMVYEMMEGAPPFSSKSPEEASALICLEGKRPVMKSKSKSFPSELKQLIEDCWHPDPTLRPDFAHIIRRLDKIVNNVSRSGRWKDTFKLPWK